MVSGEKLLVTDLVSKFSNLEFKTYNLVEDGSSIHFGIDVWAKPGAKVEKSLIGTNGELILYIRERAIDGLANKAFLKTIASLFGVSSSEIELLGGGKSKFKRFRVNLTFTERKKINYYLDKIEQIKKSK